MEIVRHSLNQTMDEIYDEQIMVMHKRPTKPKEMNDEEYIADFFSACFCYDGRPDSTS